MGIIAYADQNIIEKLNSFSQKESFSIGLVIAQKSDDSVYITHLAPLPAPLEHETESPPEAKCASQKPTSLLSTPDHLLAMHASQVIRMLPGGLDVLGIYITTPSSELASASSKSKLRTIFTVMHKATSKYYLGTKESSQEKIILYKCTQTMKIGVKAFDLSEQESIVMTSLKTQETKWIQLNYNYFLSYPIYLPKEKTSQPLSKTVLTGFRPWADSLHNTLMLIDGKVFGQNDHLVEAELKHPSKKLDTEAPGTNSVIQTMDIQILENQNAKASSSISEFQESSGSILFKGTLAGRAFLNFKASASDASQAVRMDLIRSLVSRWEMHCDSLVEEPHGSSGDPILHEPPRRVFLKDGTSPISLCDYLFPGDIACDACESAKEILGLNISEEDIEDSVEKWADPGEFHPPESLGSFMNNKGYKEISSVRNSNVLQLLAAISVALLSLVLCYFLSISKG